MTRYCIRYKIGHSRLWRTYKCDTRTGLWAWKTGLGAMVEWGQEWEEEVDDVTPPATTETKEGN